jgi:5'-3' exonuclease
MGKLMFIDANNLGVRSAFANSELHADTIDFSKDFNPDDTLDGKTQFPTGAIHGFFRSITSYRKEYPEHYLVAVWDGGYPRRLAMSQEAVKTGAIPEAYKENRRKKDAPQPIKDFVRQKPEIQAMLSLTNIPQVIVRGEEADDVIASYVDQDHDNELIAQTTDKDYYQLFRDKVTILRGDGIMLDRDWFVREYGIQPKQWVDVAAFMGDDGDNIFGVPGWGEGTSCKYIAEHGDYQTVLRLFHEQYDKVRDTLPDLSGEEFRVLKGLKNKKGHSVYPDLTDTMPFTGVAMAYENGKIKLPKVALTALMYESRTGLAYSLKMMRKDIKVPALPATWDRQKQDEFVAVCDKYQLSVVSQDADVICAKQPA